MIIAIMFVTMLLFFVSAMFIKSQPWRTTLSTVFAVIFVVSTGLMTANYSHHFGMHQVTTTKTQTVYPARPGAPLALYQPLGTDGSEQVLIYRKNAQQSHLNHTPASEHTKATIKLANRANVQMVTRTTRWQTKPGLSSFLFKDVGTSGKIVHQKITITYPKTYVKVTTKQAKRLAKVSRSRMQSQQAQAAAKAYVIGQVQAARVKHPRMSAAQLKRVQQQAQMQYQARLIRQAIQK